MKLVYKDKVVVQIKDIKMMAAVGSHITHNIAVCCINYYENDNGYFQFFDQEDIKALLDADYIIDYFEVRNNQDSILKKVNLITEEIEFIEKTLSELPLEQQKENLDFLIVVSKLKYKAIHYMMLYNYFNKKCDLPLPLIPDIDDKNLLPEINSDYVLQNAVEETAILISKKNGEKINLQEPIPPMLSLMGTIMLSKKTDNNHDYTVSYSCTTDHKYAVLNLIKKETSKD